MRDTSIKQKGISRKYFKEVKDGVTTKPKPVSILVVAKAKSFNKKLNKLRKKAEKANEEYQKIFGTCKHEVLYDEPGFMYATRNCLACGCTVGLI